MSLPRLSDPSITAMISCLTKCPILLWPVRQSVQYILLLVILILVKSLFASGDKSSSDSLSLPFGFLSQPAKLALQLERGPGRSMTGGIVTSHWPPAIFIATGKGWIRTDARPDKSTFAFCLQAVKNQGFSLPIQSQYSFWSEHFN